MPTNEGAFYFYVCVNLSLSNVNDVLNLSGTNNLSLMFEICQSITNIPNINYWDTSNVTDMSYMFQGAEFFDDNIILPLLIKIWSVPLSSLGGV